MELDSSHPSSTLVGKRFLDFQEICRPLLPLPNAYLTRLRSSCEDSLLADFPSVNFSSNRKIFFKWKPLSNAHLATFSYKMVIYPVFSNTENWWTISFAWRAWWTPQKSSAPEQIINKAVHEYKSEAEAAWWFWFHTLSSHSLGTRHQCNLIKMPTLIK